MADPKAFIESAMTFDDIKRYIASRDLEDPTIGNATLIDLRTKIQGEQTVRGQRTRKGRRKAMTKASRQSSRLLTPHPHPLPPPPPLKENEADHARLRNHLINRRAKSTAEEIKRLAKAQQLTKEQKLKETAALAELRMAKQKAEEKELRAGLERERVLRQLKSVNEDRLKELSKERTKELEIIEMERQELLRKEVRVGPRSSSINANFALTPICSNTRHFAPRPSPEGA